MQLDPAALENPELSAPRIGAFGHCSGHGCEVVSQVTLSPEQQRAIRAELEPPPSNAADERARVARVIARFEDFAGQQTDTSGDVGGTFAGLLRSGQLDCVDETLNTQTYLTILANEGLLRWHDVGAPAGRGRFFDGYPHLTAVIVERQSGAAHAVDSWFHANGEVAEVVTLADWLDGWQPAGS